MKRPPRIAIAYWRTSIGKRTNYYLHSLQLAGAEAILHRAGKLSRQFDGLLLAGGTTDINSSLYGARRGPTTIRPNRLRDKHELECLRHALDHDMPVLAICRGHQLLNIALGGSLLQEITGHSFDKTGASGWHKVILEGAGRLAAVYPRRRQLNVNSRHHQALTREHLADSLIATASSTDGYVEAVESRDHRWVVGVQWHPERPEMKETADQLFQAFVDACS